MISTEECSPITSGSPAWLKSLAREFRLGKIRAGVRIQTGLIQETWRLETAAGNYIGQKLHPDFTREVTEDARTISTFLNSRSFSIPRFLTTVQDELHLELEGRSWRVMTCLPGNSHRVVPSPGYLEQAGYTVGRMHRLLRGFEHQFRFQLPHFHDTEHICRELATYPEEATVVPEIDFLCTTVPELLLPRDLPRQIIHGDLKLTNFLFDANGRVVGLVDLDTFMYHTIYVELGDALRSWCTSGEHFSLSALRSGLAGYAHSGSLAELEPEFLVGAIKLITLELGMRYLKDYFEDRYFGWDAQLFRSRREHNLARCRRQVAVYRDMLRQEQELARTVVEVGGRVRQR